MPATRQAAPINAPVQRLARNRWSALSALSGVRHEQGRPAEAIAILERVLAIDRMVFNRNGDIEPVKMTKDGPGSLPLPRKP